MSSNDAITAAAFILAGEQGERDDFTYRTALLAGVTKIRTEAAAASASRDGSYRDPVTVGEYLSGVDRVEEAFAAGRTKDGGKILTGVTVRSAVQEPAKNGGRPSGRVLVTLTSFNEDEGRWEDEVARTERLKRWDGEWNPASRLVADTARALVGHKVKVWIEMVKMASGDPLRVIRHLEDRGVDTDFDPGAAHGPRPRRNNAASR